jgi:F-type H+-transporting ATPase subunit gamma
MAGGQERLLRRRIRTVESTKKITRAMELIAASQMVRAQSRITGSRPYLNGIEKVLADVAADGTAPERLIGTPESPSRVGVLAIVSDRGLCGGYNVFVLRAADRLVRTGQQAGRSYTLTTAGRKALAYFRFRGRQVDHTFNMPDRPTYEDARKVAATVVPRFVTGELDLVQLVSTRFHSAGSQTVEVKQLLPLEPGSPVEPTQGSLQPTVLPQGGADVREGEGVGGRREGFFEYEPVPEDLLALLVPRYAEAALYQAMLEASASEHVARQRAMAAATDNADELIKNLRRVMNRARQDSITTEIMEIAGGAEALRQAAAGEDSAAQMRDYEVEETAT